MMNGNPDGELISVVVCTYNRAEYLQDCLKSLMDQSLPGSRYEIVVSDDGSKDTTQELVQKLSQEAADRTFRYAGQDHAGLNAARNNGIRTARGKIVLFFDDDQLAPPDFLQKISAAFAENPDVDGVGGPVHDTGRSNLRTCSGCSLAAVTLGETGKHFAKRLLGGNMALRSKLFDRIGLFDAAISGRGDETEWFARATDLKLLYDPDLWAWHRRDGFTLFMLCKTSFRQGLAFPVYKQKVGSQYSIQPARIVRFVMHAFLHKCARGFMLASRDIGAIVGYVKMRFA